MFRRISDPDSTPIHLSVEGKPIIAYAGETVAAAMLTAGFKFTRTTPVEGTLRAPFCMMGTCFDCLVEIDGIPNQQACQTLARDGMQVNFQQGAGDIDS